MGDGSGLEIERKCLLAAAPSEATLAGRAPELEADLTPEDQQA